MTGFATNILATGRTAAEKWGLRDILNGTGRRYRPFAFAVPSRLRVAAGLVDAVIYIGLALLFGQALHLSSVGTVALFFAIRFVSEVGLITLVGRTPGRAIFKLFVSDSRQWPMAPQFRHALTRHLYKSGDLLFVAIVILTATAAAIGEPTTVAQWLGLIVVIPLALAFHLAFLITPMFIFFDLKHSKRNRPIHDAMAGTYVFATRGIADSRPVILNRGASQNPAHSAA